MSVMSEGAQRLLDEQTSELLVTSWKVRLVAGAAIAVLVGLLVLSGAEGWQPYLAPMVLYSVLALAMLRVSRLKWAVALAPMSMVIDVAFITFVQWRGLTHSAAPSGVAGFTLGLFALLICVNGLAMRGPITWATAVFSSVGQLWLMREASVGPGAQLLAPLVLGLTAVATRQLAQRLARLVATLSSAEVERQMQQRRFTEVEQARHTIEQMLEDARATNVQLTAVQREKEVLSQVLVHDLRSPLSVVLVNTRWLTTELRAGLAPEDVPEAIDALTQVQDVAKRMTQMVNDLLNIGKLETKSLALTEARFGAHDLLNSVAEEFGRMAKERHLTIGVECEGELPMNADRALLTRVLENLTANALRYTPAQGRVQLCAAVTASGVQLSVNNDGVGIPGSARGALFQRFQQLGNAAEQRSAGFGLGLYFCRLVADAHQGSIAVEDVPGWATSMVLRLPQTRVAP